MIVGASLAVIALLAFAHLRCGHKFSEWGCVSYLLASCRA